MRRFWIALLAMALMVPSALAQTAAVSVGEWEADGYDMLLNVETGEMFTAPQEWIRIYRLTGTPDDAPFFAAMPVVLTTEGSQADEPLYALMDGQGRCLTGAEYRWLEYYLEDGVVVGQRPDESQCALSIGGETLLDGGYALVLPNGEGGWLVMEDAQFDEYGSANGELTLIAADGTRTDTGVRADRWSVSAYSSGRCRVSGDDETIYLDASGREVFRLEGGYGLDFAQNTAIFCNADGLFGLVDISGAEVLPAVYNSLDRSAQYGAQAVLLGTRLDGTMDMYDADGATLLLTVNMNDGNEDDYYYTYQDSRETVEIGNNERSEVYTTSGEHLFSAVHAEEGDLSGYSMSYAVVGEGETPQRCVRQEGQWPEYKRQMAMLDGTPVGEAHREISPQIWMDGHARCVAQDYELKPVDDDWRIVDGSLRAGVIDENGEVILDVIYDSVEILDMDRYWVRMGDEYALLDGAGNELAKLSDYSRLMD